MAETVTIARPYAEALYRLASETKALDQWSEMLAAASAVANDETMRDAIGNPKLTRADVEAIFLSVLGKRLNAAGENLVRLLVHNGRLAVLPQIAALFEKLRAEQSGVMEADIASAFPLAAAQIEELAALLEKRFARKVTTRVSVDPELLGGVKIIAGDVVIDASVRGQLDKMAFALKR